MLTAARTQYFKRRTCLQCCWNGGGRSQCLQRQRADSCPDQQGCFHEPPAKLVCCPKQTFENIGDNSSFNRHKAGRHNVCFKTSLHVHVLNYQHTPPYVKYCSVKYGLYTVLRGPPPETPETRVEKMQHARI